MLSTMGSDDMSLAVEQERLFAELGDCCKQMTGRESEVHRHIPLNLVGDISVYLTACVMEACPRYA